MLVDWLVSEAVVLLGAVCVLVGLEVDEWDEDESEADGVGDEDEDRDEVE
jgi:hypothetical protein